MSGDKSKSVLFVCLGNICRSPIAEAVFLATLRAQGKEGDWKVDSAGTIDYHEGKNPDARARKVLQEKKVVYEHKARMIRSSDFGKFRYIVAMDKHNERDLKAMKSGGSATVIVRLGEFDPQKVTDVRDPYYDDGDAGFYVCYDHCLRACEAFMEAVERGDV